MAARRRREGEKKQYAAQGQFGVFPSYRGGPTTTYNGYVWEFVGDHPSANIWGFAPQHRLVGEDLAGRPLRKDEVVHHEDEDRTNNDPANLAVMTQAAHRAHHAALHGRRMRIPLLEEEVAEALRLAGGIKPAARLLGCSHCTLRTRFPKLCAPYRRTRPTKLDDPRDLAKVLAAAPRRDIGLRELMRDVKMSPRTILRLCAKNGVKWRKKKRSDAGRRQRKAIRRGSKSDGRCSAPVNPMLS